MIKNIILDVGKVLVAWEPLEAMRTLGFEEEAVEAVANATIRTAGWDESDRGALSDEELLAGFIQNAPEYETQICQFWNNIDAAITQFPYSVEWIKGMKKKGYHVYILSNYASCTYEKTKEGALSFLQYVDDAIFSFQVKQIKPNADIYQTLLHKFDLTAEECVFLDDVPANIKAAGEAGIHGIVFKNQQQANEELLKLGVTL